MQVAKKERDGQCHTTHVWGLVSILVSIVSIVAGVSFLWILFASPCLLTFLYTDTPSAFTLSDDCENLIDKKLDSLSQIYHLYDGYYINVVESKCSSGTLKVCVSKYVSTTTSITLRHVSAKESPLCDHKLRSNCLPSACFLNAHRGLDNWLGLSLLHPNQTNSYLILNIEANEEYRKNVTDQPQLLRDVWLDMIRECHTLIPLGLASLITVFIVGALWLVLTCILLPCVCRECKR